MKYSVDWANKKKYRIKKIGSKKIKSILPTREAFDEFFKKLSGNHSFYLEWGGGDTFKLLALRNKHKVFCIAGKKIKEYRERLGKEKTDKNDARVIGRFAKKYPEEFYEFKEDDKLTLMIGILSKEISKTIEDCTRKKNQLIAFKRMMELVILEKPKVAKMVKQKKQTIESLQIEVKALKLQLKRVLRKHLLWVDYLKDIKGIGEVAAGKIIGSIKRFSRFSNRYSLRHFAGMIAKKDNHSYNRQLKQALYIFSEGIIKNRTRPWRNIYDSRKKDYKKKHPDWKPGKLNAFAKKFVQTQFLNELWEMGKTIESK